MIARVNARTIGSPQARTVLGRWSASQLAGGKAAVGVLVREDQAPSVSEKLGELGGTPQTVPAKAMAEAEEAAPQVEQEEVAAGHDLSIIDGIGSGYADTLKASKGEMHSYAW